MDKMKDVYITALGTFLPGEPICNEEMESYLGEVNGKKSRVKERILKQNGITTRHYALDKNQQSQYLNADMAAFAVKAAIAKSQMQDADIELLCAATTQGDLAAGVARRKSGALRPNTFRSAAARQTAVRAPGPAPRCVR